MISIIWKIVSSGLTNPREVELPPQGKTSSELTSCLSVMAQLLR